MQMTKTCTPGRSMLRRLALSLALASLLTACSGDSVESLLASGKSLAEKKDYAGATIQFKSALQQNPDSAPARSGLGRALLASGDATAAIVELTKALELQADPSEVVPVLAQAYMATGQFAKLTSTYGDAVLPQAASQAALKTTLVLAWAAQGNGPAAQAALEAALAAVPDFPRALVLRSRVEAGLGQTDQAMATIERALQQDPALHEAWHVKGVLLLAQRQAGTATPDDAAVQAWRKAVELEPKYLPAHLSLISDRLRVRDIDGARPLLEQLRKVLPAHPETVYLQAQVALWDRDFPLAKERVDAMLRVVPDNPLVLQLAGAVELQLGALLRAESHLVKALQLRPTLHFPRRNLGQVYLRMGQPAKTLETLQPLLDAKTTDPDVHAIAGQALLALGRHREAESTFRLAMQQRPGDARIRTALALTQLQRGDTESGLSQLQDLAAEPGPQTVADMALISARLARNEFDQALSAVNALLAKDGEKAGTLELRGRVQRLRKDLPAAREDFERALKLEPTLFAATVGLAALDLQEQKPEAARSRMQASLQADPRNHLARLTLADLRLRGGAELAEVKSLLEEGVKLEPQEAALRLQLIELLLNRQSFAEALAAAQQAAAALPNDLRVQDALGRSQALGGEVEQAIRTFRRMADQDQRSALPHLRLAEAHQRAGRQPAAEAALRKALEIQPDLPVAQQALAALLLSSDRPRETIEFARSLQTRQPRAPGGYVLEAVALERQKNVDQALAVFRRGLAVKDHNRELALQYYLALLRNGRVAEGERYASTWLQANPDHVSFDHQVAVAALQRQDLPRAEARLRRLAEQHPDHAPTLNNLAWAMASQGKTGGSAYAQRAVDLAPQHPGILDTLALALLVDKQPAKALEVQKRAVALQPEDPSYRLGLARIALDAGDPALARQELDRLEALGTAFARQDEVKALKARL